MLLLEATHPDDQGLLKKHEDQLVRALGKVLELPQQLFLRGNVHAELHGVDDTVREIAAAGPFPPVPLRVVTGGLTPRGDAMSPAAVGARRAHQQELARLSPLGEQVIAQKSGHFPQLTRAGTGAAGAGGTGGGLRLGVQRAAGLSRRGHCGGERPALSSTAQGAVPWSA